MTSTTKNADLQDLRDELELVHSFIQSAVDSLNLSKVLDHHHTRIMLAHTADCMFQIIQQVEAMESQGGAA